MSDHPLLIHKLRSDFPDGVVLSAACSLADIPVIYATDEKAVSAAEHLYGGADGDYPEVWTETFREQTPDVVRLPAAVMWLEFLFGDRIVGAMIDAEPERFSGFGQDAVFAATLDIFEWRHRAPEAKSVRWEHPGLLWQERGEWDLCGGLVGDSFDDEIEAIKCLLRLLSAPKMLRVSDEQHPVPHRRVTVEIPR